MVSLEVLVVSSETITGGGLLYKISKGEQTEDLGVPFQRMMRVHRMIRQLVPALSGCWPGDILVVLLLGVTNLTRKLKIYGPKMNSCRKAAEGLARRTRSRH